MKKAGALIFAFLVYAALRGEAAAPTFNRDIRPILSDNCYACHGPDKNARKAKLRLDNADGGAFAEKEGKYPLVPGKPQESELLKRITSTDPEEVMPPPKTGKKLSAQQIATIREWIAAGAKYEAHWAYIAPRRAAIPQVKTPEWPINPVDYFILARLEQEGLHPSPEADRRTLARRLSFDLDGLPPRPEQVEVFEKSKESDAYTKLVNSYVNSPHFGERMAVHWIDLVRYADTVGFHGDNPVSVWPYRDYVINAFNNNIPYDRFTREQLAGDLIPESSLQQKVASTFNRLNRMSTEGGIQDKEYLAKYGSDRVRTVSMVWMGATMGCCECHDHKFDPFSTKDFYQLQAFFADLNEKGFYANGYQTGDWGPKLAVPSASQTKHQKELNDQIVAITNRMAAVPDAQLASGRTEWEKRIDWLAKGDRLNWKEVVPSKAISSGGSTLSIGTNGVVRASGTLPDHDDYTVTIPAILSRITAVRLEVLREDSLPGNEVARAGDTFVIGDVEFAVQNSPDTRPKPLKVVNATASLDQPGFPVLALIDGNPNTGWEQGGHPAKERQAAFVLERPVEGSPDAFLVITIRHCPRFQRQQLAKFRFAVSEVDYANYERSGMSPVLVTIVQKPVAERSVKEQALVVDFYRKNLAPELRAMRSQLTALRRERSLLDGQIPTTLVSESTKPRPIRILPRGNWMNDSGEVVSPATPHFLSGLETGTNRATRLDLANWFTSTNNPMTARVFVNRLWKMYFGTGLSRTLDDFGIQGEWPTHPELLDWLACEFMESGWDVKHIVTLIVSSRTYQQTSQVTPVLEERDPLNRLLARQSRFRLDAEFVRDSALSISGLLVDRQGGPSVHPYQPDGYYAPLNFPKREYVPDEGEAQYRRGLYTHWQRTFVHPSLVAFDAASREECTANRVNSNTPVQALVLLNDPTYVEASRVFAKNIVEKGGRNFETRLQWAYRAALMRHASGREIELLRALYEKQLDYYREHEAAARELISVGYAPIPSSRDAAELAAWTSVARALLNLNETITRS